MRPYLASLIGSAAVAASAFLPWLRLGDVGLPGIPDPAGYFVLGVGVAGMLLSAVGMVTRRDTRQFVVLASLAALTALAAVWWTGPATVASRAEAHAQAVALVDNVPMQPAPTVTLGAGLWLGLAGALLAGGAGLTVLRTTRRDGRLQD